MARKTARTTREKENADVDGDQWNLTRLYVPQGLVKSAWLHIGVSRRLCRRAEGVPQKPVCDRTSDSEIPPGLAVDFAQLCTLHFDF